MLKQIINENDKLIKTKHAMSEANMPSPNSIKKLSKQIASFPKQTIPCPQEHM